MIGKMIAQGLAAAVVVAVLAFGYAASARVPSPSTPHGEASR